MSVLYPKDLACHAICRDVAGEAKFQINQRVRKVKGASWQGRVVGFYSTTLTPIGYAVESEREPGSVQIYPENALESAGDAKHPTTFNDGYNEAVQNIALVIEAHARKMGEA